MIENSKRFKLVLVLHALLGGYMSYGVAIKVKEGLVFASDSRTNAGLDNVNTYSKMFSL